MAMNKIKDCSLNMGAVSVHEQMLLQDRRVTVNDTSALQGMFSSTFTTIHNVASQLQSTVSCFQKTSSHVKAVFTRAVGRGYLDKGVPALAISGAILYILALYTT
jgi:hypothetical protein